MVITYDKKIDTQLSEHFTSTEFNCRCEDCKETLIDSDLILRLEGMRTILGTKIRITSGYRCAAYQKQLALRGYETAKGISQHQLGKAADVTNGIAHGAELEDAARQAGFKAVGVGKDFVHVDLRDDKPYRRWTYAY